MLGDACWIISALKDKNFILTLVYAYQIDCRRNTSDLSTYVTDFKMPRLISWHSTSVSSVCSNGLTACFPSVHVIFLASQVLLKNGCKEMEITSHVDCRKGGANFYSHSHKTGCQLAVLISFDLLRSMWLVSHLQQTLTLEKCHLLPADTRHCFLFIYFLFFIFFSLGYKHLGVMEAQVIECVW